jgi:chromosome segregation ATPase
VSRKLGEVTLQNQQLFRDLNDAHTSLDNQSVIHEAHRRSEVNVRQLQAAAMSHEEVMAQLKAECAETHSQNQALTKELQGFQAGMERELEERLGQELSKLALAKQEKDVVTQERDRAMLELERVEQELCQLKQEHDGITHARDSMKQEWDKMKAELEAAGSMVKDATSSLKFKLSSQNIELQQVKEVKEESGVYFSTL